ncbi:MAG: hypothetical protein IPG84_13765 [Betaproteobacteria bacterium]|nr:hypothetical protein [Betaproteobacteria bacterium]
MPGRASRVGHRLVRDRVRDVRRLEHLSEAPGREVRIDRQVSTARLQHREPGDRHVRRVRARDGDERAGPDAALAQLRGESVGGSVEPRIVEPADRRRRRHSRRLRFEARRDRGHRRRGGDRPGR